MGPKEGWYYQCLVKWTAAKGRPPTLKQLAEWTESTISNVYKRLSNLERKGYLTRDKDRRFIVLVEVAFEDGAQVL